jgi:chemotaxis methyl-accepting protein methylase
MESLSSGKQNGAVQVSSRAMNPLSLGESPHDVFCNLTQAKATTATRLFRDHEIFNSLRQEVLPVYLQKPPGRTLSIWSAGCSSGEESYSLAMVAADEFKKRRLRGSFLVFGTDISPDQLAKARQGTYLSPSERQIGADYSRILKVFSVKNDATISMNAEIKGKIRFGQFDLRKKPKTHTFDYVVCNHVLQYYDIPSQLHIIQNMCSVLKKGGFLFLEGLTVKTVEPSGLRQVSGYSNLYLPGKYSDHG